MEMIINSLFDLTKLFVFTFIYGSCTLNKNQVDFRFFFCCWLWFIFLPRVFSLFLVANTVSFNSRFTSSFEKLQ